MIAVITGASSGIGAATARKLAKQGLSTVLVARRLDKLDQLAQEIRSAGGEADVLPVDLAQENDRQELCRTIHKRHGFIDILINNAGFGWYGYGADMPVQTALEMLQVNVAAVVQLSIAFLAQMRERGKGHIINIGSIAGSLPSQGVALYGATKSFLDNFTTALHREMSGTPVRLSVVRAGPVITDFCETAAQRKNGLHLPTERMGVRPEVVAERIWGLIRHPRRVIYVPRYLQITPWIEAYFGWLIDHLGPLLLRYKRG